MPSELCCVSVETGSAPPGYFACEGNATLAVFKLNGLKADQSFATGDDPGVLAYDCDRATLYVAAESGGG